MRKYFLLSLLFAVAENYGVQSVVENDKNHAVALAKEGSYGGISRDTTAFKPLSASLYNACTSTKLTEPDIPLLGAARLGSKKLTHQALCKGANPNVTDELGNSPLHYAVHLGSKSITELLLCHHADPNMKNNKGKTPLDIAVQSENNYIIRRLILYGAHPQGQPIQADSVNILTKKYIQCAKTTNLAKLQQLGSYSTINKNAQIGKHKRTALMYAARNNRTAIASYLVNSMKVDSSIKDAYGNTARDYAKKHSNPQLLEMLS